VLLSIDADRAAIENVRKLCALGRRRYVFTLPCTLGVIELELQCNILLGRSQPVLPKVPMTYRASADLGGLKKFSADLGRQIPSLNQL
jgi:hypothetical protein